MIKVSIEVSCPYHLILNEFENKKVDNKHVQLCFSNYVEL